MTRAPAVDVLLPIRNGANTIGQCLDSALGQRDMKLRVVCVDDGSTDGTSELLRKRAAEDSRVIVIPGSGQGLVPALELGLEACRAPWVARMDADDVAHRDRLRLQLAHAELHRLDGVGCQVRGFGPLAGSGNMQAYLAWLSRVHSPADVMREAWIECPVPHPTWMVRRRVLSDLGYRRELPDGTRIPEDHDLLLRSLAAGHRWGVTPRRLLAWRLHGASHSRTSDAYDRRAFVHLKAFHLVQSLLWESDRYILWGHGPTGRSLRKALKDHGRAPSHIVELHPGRIGRTLHGAEVIPPEVLDQIPKAPLLAAVSGAGPRGQIRRFLEDRGWVEGRDFVCTA